MIWLVSWLGLMAQATPESRPVIHLARSFETIEVALHTPPGSLDEITWVHQPHDPAFSPFVASMADQTYGSYRVGELFTVWNRTGQKVKGPCQIRSFVRRIVAYYGVWPEGQACGTPQVYAQLSCTSQEGAQMMHQVFIASQNESAVSALSSMHSPQAEHSTSMETNADVPLPVDPALSEKRGIWREEIQREYDQWLGPNRSPSASDVLTITETRRALPNHPGWTVSSMSGAAGDYNNGDDNFVAKRFAVWDGAQFLHPDVTHQSRHVSAFVSVHNETHMLIDLDEQQAIVNWKGQVLSVADVAYCAMGC